ncbi:MAG: ATP-binding protein [Burkholderiales bacterium]
MADAADRNLPAASFDRAPAVGADRPTVPLWRTSTAGALLAIALLVAATVGAAIWLSIIDQRRQAQEHLTRTAHQASLQIRGRLIETEQLLLLEGSGYASSAARFRSDMQDLLAANAALLRVELRARDGTTALAIDAPPPRPSLPDSLRTELSPEAAAAFDVATRMNRLSYSRPYFVNVGGTGFDLMDLVVPTGDVDGPLIVATYAPQRILDHFLPPDLPGGQLYALVEADGTVAARQASVGQARGELSAVSPLARTGTTLQVRVDAVQERPRLIPNLLTGLVAATSVGLGLAMFFLVRDIRQRARAEHALREQVQFRRAVEDSIEHGLMVFDLEGRVVHVNSAVERISGYSRDELIGLRVPLPYSTPEARRDYEVYLERILRAPDDASREAERLRGYTTQYQRRDGALIDVFIVESAVLDAAGARIGTLFLGLDVTEQRRIEDLARRQQEVLQSRSRLATLGEMASTLSHELNQPLAAITSYAAACENLVAATPPRPEPVSQALRGIKAQAERAGQVIRSVQAFLRRRAVDRGEVDLAALLRGLEPLLRLQATRTGASVSIDVPQGTIAWADRIMLEQVLLNLTRNGFEAMADVVPGDRVLAISARARADDERGERVEVTVVDRGRGVPPEVTPQLFTAFFTTKSEGMGLGLSLCRSVIEQHGGHLRYDPRPGGGSIFAFDLPRHAETAVRADPSPRSGVPS